MTEQHWERPAAGREPAAAALLAWLADSAAPRLCAITGSPSSGKSMLLAWLVAHGTRPGTPPERRVHAFAPAAGLTATTVAWTIAEQLAVPARTAGELVGALASDERRTVIVLPDLHKAADRDDVTELALSLLDLEQVRLIVETDGAAENGLTAAPSAVMNLDEPRWTDQARFAVWAAEGSSGATEGAVGWEPVDLDDPVAVCAADPWQVSVQYERSTDSHGGLRAAWLRAGGALTRDQPCAERALTLLAALGDDADPRLPQALTEGSEGAAWRVAWRRVRGDITPPWPGPARALAIGHGPLADHLLVADHQGTVRLLGDGDAVPVGRVPLAVPETVALTAHDDGTVTALDRHGRLHTQRAARTPEETGLSALLNDGPTPLASLLDEVGTYAKNVTATALASLGTTVAVADGAGKVHVFMAPGSTPRTATLHRGPVTALAMLDLPLSDDGESVPLLYSGGADGAVRLWAPHDDPLDAPVLSRPSPVTALAVTATDTGPVLAAAWADGRIEHQSLSDGTVRSFRPGTRVNALALTPAGDMVTGTDETLICLRPA